MNPVRLTDILDAIRAGRVRITDHADEETHADGLTFDEVYTATLRGEIIESYPTDHPYPSCLVYGCTFLGNPVHAVWAFNEASGWAVLITVYRPDPERWLEWRTRRPK